MLFVLLSVGVCVLCVLYLCFSCMSEGAAMVLVGVRSLQCGVCVCVYVCMRVCLVGVCSLYC